jgi:hypothetical protein
MDASGGVQVSSETGNRDEDGDVLLRKAIDAVLETTVVGSFTKVGYEARRRLYDWQDLASLDMTGKTVVITGGNSGLGLVTAKELAGLGADVRIVARNAGRGAAAVEEIDALGAGRAGLYVPTSSPTTSRSPGRRSPSGSPARRACTRRRAARPAQESVDGYGMTFAMVLGPFLLTSSPLLRAPGETSSIASGACTRRRRRRVEMGRDFRARCTRSGPRWRWCASGHAVLPAQASRSSRCTRGGPTRRGSRSRNPHAAGPILRSPNKAPTRSCGSWSPTSRTGHEALDRAPRSTTKLVPSRATAEERDKLWRLCERLTGAASP